MRTIIWGLVVGFCILAVVNDVECKKKKKKKANGDHDLWDREWDEELEELKCHKGFHGIDHAKAAEVRKICHKSSIKHEDCYRACVAEIAGVFKDGEWQEDKKNQLIESIFDKTADGTASATKVKAGVQKCTKEHESKMKEGYSKKNDFQGECEWFSEYDECILNATDCE